MLMAADERALGQVCPSGEDAASRASTECGAAATLAVGKPISRPRLSPWATAPSSHGTRPRSRAAASTSRRSQQLADARRRHRRAVDLEQRSHGHVEAELDARGGQPLGRARGAVAVAEVRRRPSPCRRPAAGEARRGRTDRVPTWESAAVNGTTITSSGPISLGQLDASGERCQLRRGQLGAHHGRRDAGGRSAPPSAGHGPGPWRSRPRSPPGGRGGRRRTARSRAIAAPGGARSWLM